MQESLEGEGDSKLKGVSNGGQKRAQEMFFPLGKKAPFIGLQISDRLRSFRAQAVLPLEGSGSTASLFETPLRRYFRSDSARVSVEILRVSRKSTGTRAVVPRNICTGFLKRYYRLGQAVLPLGTPEMKTGIT